MASLDSLPFDVIDCILSCECISCADICGLACVSQIFNSIARSNTLWRKKYKQMWPDLAVLYNVPNTDWRCQFIKQYSYKRLVTKKLSELSAEFYHAENISDDAFSYFKDIVQQEEFGFEIVIHELEKILHDSNSHLNLTHKYYAEQALRYVCHVRLKNLWQEFLSKPLSKISLVEGACLLSQWYHPTNSKCTVNVSSLITKIAARVLELVKQNYPKHPVIERGLTDGVLTESLWTPPQCKQVINCVDAVMFKELKFYVTERTDLDPICIIFIDQVLDKKKGHSSIVSIIYAEIAGKLGVSCLPVNFPPQFLLKWLEHPELTDEKEAYGIIDVFRRCDNYRLIDLHRKVYGNEFISMHLTDAVRPINIFDRIARLSLKFIPELHDVEGENIFRLCDSLVLLCLLSPDDMEHKLSLATLYTQMGINSTEAFSMLEEIADRVPMSRLTQGDMYQSTMHTLENTKITHPSVKQNFRVRDDKSKHLKFAVGMIMRHKRYNYRCVIYGWDPVCKASIDWIRRMGVYNLVYKDEQPFYHVLVSDGTNRYAAEENLEIDKENIPVDHIQVGRYFESFHDSYYLPNEHTKSEYPDDMPVRERALFS